MSTSIEVPATARERGRTAPAKLAHIVLRSPRYEEVIDWYRTVLEAEVMVGTPAVTFLTYDEEHHRIAVINAPGVADADPMAGGVDHVAFTYETVDDLFITYERLKGLGIEPHWTINHGPTLSFYYADPDGNRVELQIDVFDTNEAVNAWMAQSDFGTNPIGVKVDPEELIARHRAGEDRATLLDRRVIDPADLMAQLPDPPPAG
ncbi:MAG: VOC family protein [Actinomycetota bacterium]